MDGIFVPAFVEGDSGGNQGQGNPPEEIHGEKNHVQRRTISSEPSSDMESLQNFNSIYFQTYSSKYQIYQNTFFRT